MHYLHIEKMNVRALILATQMHVPVFQGVELLSASHAGNTADVNTLLKKAAHAHFIGKVSRSLWIRGGICV